MISRRSHQTRRLSLRAVAAISVLLSALAGATPAFAEAPPAPHWKLESRSAPTNLPLKGVGIIVATASNVGDGEVNGEAKPVTFTDQLPSGLEVTAVNARTRGTPGGERYTATCPPGNPIVCTFVTNLAPYQQIEIIAHVRVNYEHVSEPDNEVSVVGGETPSESLSQPLKVNGKPTEFGVESLKLTPENEEFQPAVQAGSHPFQLTTTFDLNQTEGHDPTESVSVPTAPALQRNLSFKLPPGLIGNANVVGNPNAVQQCPGASFGAHEENSLNNCPEGTAVGVAAVTFNDPILLLFDTYVVPVFNLVPAPGEPARFGFELVHVPIILDTSVRTGEDYGATVSIRNTSQAVQVLGARVTFWGVPGDPRHDSARGWECLGRESFVIGPPRRGTCKPLELPGKPAPFLTLPTSCGPLATTVEGEAWNAGELKAKGQASTLEAKYESPPGSALTGCGELPFDPSIEVSPTQHTASTPTDLTVKVSVPQQSTLEAEGKAEADVRSTTLELPEGLQASPGAADGLGACGVAEAGFSGLGTDTGKGLEKELEAQHFTPAAATCADAAKIGTVNIKTPLLEKELTGSVYLGSQNTNPFESPLVLYIVAEEEKSKVLVKLAGEIEISETTGRLVSKFKNTPQTPFESLTVHLFKSERATQATPAFCGGYHATAQFTNWSGETVTERGSNPEQFQITSGPNGTPCPGAALPFGPSFHAETTNTQAGAFTPFTLTINHLDGDQALGALTMRLPPGLAAMLSSLTPCPEPQAAHNACGPESLIGHSTANSGLGGHPYSLPGRVYLTGPYKGAPFGVSVVTPAVAGPFNLGDVTVRSTINVDPNTAAVTITSDPFPTIIKGVPAQVKQVNVTVDRAGFQFNPTSCTPMAITGTLTGSEGGSHGVSSPFQVGNCASLPFSPKLTASVSGQGSKANGTTFTVKVESARGQANIAKTFLQLPVALPSRLSTIQQACLSATFEANPARCGEGSNIGFAVAHTPVLKKPLVGPAYLVSHGNAAFPDVEFVLQSEGITVVLDGKTDIKNGITYSRFETVPDAPVETFETVLPAGPHSALTANVPESENFNLCKTPLDMPTEITGQNGTVLKQTTKIALTGCVLGFKVKKSKLQVALEQCRKKYKGKAKAKKRVACEKRARKKYAHKAARPKKK
jgi:hypothetical protein